MGWNVSIQQKDTADKCIIIIITAVVITIILSAEIIPSDCLSSKHPLTNWQIIIVIIIIIIIWWCTFLEILCGRSTIDGVKDKA